MEGERAGDRRAIDLANRDVVTCSPHDPIRPLRDQVDQSPYRFALVLADNGVLLGRIPHAAWEGDQSLRAEAVIRPGPKTHRPNVAPDKLFADLAKRNLTAALLTDPDGRLLGVVPGEDLEPGA